MTTATTATAPGRRLLVLAAVQTLALLAMILLRQWTLETGARVVLETAPVDPRSLFQGDYVILAYRVGALNLETLAGDRDLAIGDDAWVVLRPGEPGWTAAAIHRTRPTAADGVVMRGRVNHVDSGCRPPGATPPCPTIIRIGYGIESYFVPEGTGRELEDLVRRGSEDKVTVEVAVNRFGTAAIAALRINGERRTVEGLW